MGTNDLEDNKKPDPDDEEKASHPESLGSYLRKERLKKGLNLQEIAEGTCIHIATLKALEEDDESRMPAEVFTRGFLRLYAEHIGIDSRDVLKRYDRAKEKTRGTGYQVDTAGREKNKQFSLDDGTGKKTSFFLVLLFVVLGLLAYFWFFPSLK